MNSRTIVAECCFLDVGQGTCNILLLGDRRAIVIDCGPPSIIPYRFLSGYVDRIVTLIISHNDHDHYGGASRIIAAYPRAIDQIYFLQDRPIGHLKLFAVVKDAWERGLLTTKPIRLEADREPRIIYCDVQADLSLELLFPSFAENLEAQSHSHPNATSGVLALFCGDRSIVFAGDSTVDNWRTIRDGLGKRIETDILAVPHHGGCIVNRSITGEDRVAEELHWLYREAVHPRYAIISTGTSNTHGHPVKSTIRALRECGATVICTQVTDQCHSNLEALRPGIISPTSPSASSSKADYTRNGRIRNLACASTVFSEVGPDVVTIRRLVDHQDGVDSMAKMSQGHPLCRSL